jgi:tetratricopeptide (TPR) repeat protein
MKFIPFAFLFVVFFSCHAQTPENHYNVAIEQFEKKNFTESLSSITKALKITPYKYKYLILKGDCEMELQMWVDALSTFTLAIESNPEKSIAYDRRCTIYHLAGLFDLSIQDSRKALELAEHDSLYVRYIVSLSSSYIATRMFYDAVEILLEALKKDPENISVLNNLGFAAYEAGEKLLSFDSFYTAYKLDTTSSMIVMNLGYFHQREEKYEESLLFLQKAVELDPECAYCYNNLGYSQYKLGQYKQGLKNINKSLKIYPTNSYAYRNRGLIYLSMNKKRKACADFQKALQLGYTDQYGDDVQTIFNTNCH